ncbi:hypothetical protein scyTo_0005601 [Scyliorhinus torazame]|uniref:WD repeat-containing protein 93 n=1 Tax=Scyliorhinus torazame TaxID=75743 RepID=A0A401PA60_SCYTO|nr:hypothetical protein [Scyliorhinus torazame]
MRFIGRSDRASGPGILATRGPDALQPNPNGFHPLAERGRERKSVEKLRPWILRRMLSYSHKYLEVPTPTEHNWIEGDEDHYYLKDPDLRLDNLPQPFRMIDKLIGCIIDGAWESIERREAEREAEKLKIKPPTRESSEEIQLPRNLNCFANSVDGNYIFAGLSEGVGVLNMEDHTVKSVWNMEGVARLIFSYGGAFALIKVFNAFDNKRSVQPSPLPATQTQQDSPTSNKQANLLNVQDAKLTPTVLVTKQRPKQITDYLWKNPFDALQKLDDANIIGTGQNHVISAQQWTEEKKIFEEMYYTYLSKDTSEESEEKQSQATFHFLYLGRIFPVGLEQRTQFGIPNTLCVWWHGSHVLLHYALKIPVGKEKIELDPKADIVWPNASPITCSVSDVCASLLVIALADGTITIWDLYLGIPISVLSVSRDSTIRNLHFLESSFCVPFGSSNEYKKVQVLVTCKHGAVYLVTATKHTEGSISTLRKRNEEPGITVSAIALVPQLSKLLLIFTNGTIALLDLIQGDVLCHCILPPSHVIASPWEPVFGFDKGGSFLFIKGDEKLNDDSLDRKESSSSLFAFSLLFLFPLDNCRKGKVLQKPPTPNTWEKRCEHCLQER